MNRYLIGAVAWALLILILTLTPGKAVPDIGLFDYDKLGHAGIFMVQSYLIIMGLYKVNPLKGNRLKYALSGLVIVVLYGFAIEYAQSFIPDRGMELYDAIANIIGSFFGVTLFYLHNKLFEQ
ncbi:VanZ family protein [Fulvivirga sp. M361]|uniref:VanZ family protein n=1 Tax=Fulvivirga sp. M361 TaxID=2594266 RepID=UPI00117AE699|nr:VanZ family protein [Fulvivirga sp. M361]TRX55574.1 VanZ family protein [Fulvivirga sp. M361]